MPSIHAEQLAINEISRKYNKIIKQKGRNITIVIDNNGKCSRPCKMCHNLLIKTIPLCKVQYTNNEGEEVCNSLNNIDDVKHSYGTRTRFLY